MEMQKSKPQKQKSFINNFDVFKFNNIGICMIDIVGFSNWCSKQTPRNIVKTMISYNGYIVDILSNYKCLEKIELVGDCCMIVSGCNTEEDIYYCISCLMEFCVDLISNIDKMKSIFDEIDISIRIGIHIGDVVGCEIKNPLKYQLFGNDINVASRLESACVKETIHISEKAKKYITFNQHNDILFSKRLDVDYKGVGIYNSYVVFLQKKYTLYIFSNELKLCKYLNISNTTNTQHETNVHKGFELLKSYHYDNVILDSSFMNINMIADELQKFREWESLLRDNIQKIDLLIWDKTYKLDNIGLLKYNVNNVIYV